MLQDMLIMEEGKTLSSSLSFLGFDTSDLSNQSVVNLTYQFSVLFLMY